MKKHHRSLYTLAILALIAALSLDMACGGKANFLGKKAGVPLKIQEVDPNPGVDDPINNPGGGTGGEKSPDEYQKVDPDKIVNGLNPIFNGIAGMVIDPRSMMSIATDQSGYNALTDSDGDGIPDDEELGAEFTNPFVSDCPRITTRIDTPVFMEIVYEYQGKSQSHEELVTDSDVKNTINNSMENKQYNQLNLKTTPYPVKNAQSMSYKNAGSNGYSNNFSLSAYTGGGKGQSMGTGADISNSMSVNTSFDNEFSMSTDSEKTVFQNVNYVDNLNRSGTEFKNDTTERVSKNLRQSSLNDSTTTVGPNAGHVSGSLFIVNESRNIPVRVSNIKCTLSFRTPSGNCLAVKTFLLRNDDYSEFDEEIYGGEELGPFMVDVQNLNTVMVKNALANGYVPQISVDSYDMHKVENSNYNPGVDNLKIVEETAKSRTAVIKIIGTGMREMYRVPAFEVKDGLVTPGISLKKALFRIYQDRIGAGEYWENDKEGEPLTVAEQGLKWKAGFLPDPKDPTEYKYGANTRGNTWRLFSTYVKSYQVVDRNEDGTFSYHDRHIETIERIGALKRYNPFSKEDNPSYNASDTLTAEEFGQLKYWVILHNGRYFEGDINDPIWAGERYEIVLFDAKDFNERFATYAYAPLMNTAGSTGGDTGGGSSSDNDFVDYSSIQTNYDFILNTLWNRQLNDISEFSRARFLGKVVRGDVIKLDVQLDEYRSLFDITKPGAEFGDFSSIKNSTGQALSGKMWNKFGYTFDNGETPINGIPSDFTFRVWGGCNQVVINIVEADNAADYTVSLWSGDARVNVREITVLPSDLKENNGYIILHRKTKDTTGAVLGELAAGAYHVEVRANGSSYNVPVSTKSGSGTIGVTVEEPPLTGNIYPKAFTIVTEGMTNGMKLVVNQGEDTEYYIADVYGPYNYGWGNGDYTPPMTSFTVHAGSNMIPLPKSGLILGRVNTLTEDELNWAVPGVYKVLVYGVNKNCPLDAAGKVIRDQATVQLPADPVPVLVDYNRYEDQKKLVGRKQIEKFNPKDVDLEVNFNDGSGWFRLQLSNDDYTTDDRTLDCRYTTNFEQNQGRVTIYFKAPTGGTESKQNQYYNVFRGGKEDVEVYLRTVAKPEYRDSIWLKSSEIGSYNPDYPDLYRCININSQINDLPGYDPLKYWINNENTDVNMIENYTAGGSRVYASPLDFINRVSGGDFGVVANGGKNDFFFSPMKKLTYKVGVSLADVDIDYLMSEKTHVDNPLYRVKGGDQSIFISNIDSQYGQNYTCYLKPGHFSSLTENLDLAANNWQKSAPFLDWESPHYYKFSTYSGVALLPNKEYTICMIADNDTPSTSSRVYQYVWTIPSTETHTLSDAVDDWGAGLFINAGPPLTNNMGNMLLPGVDFAYGQPLNSGSYNIYDMGNTYSVNDNFSTNKYIRIVNNGVNVASASGLNLTPVAWDMGTTGLQISPPKNQVYIDPVSSQYIMPRPVYWSTCDSADAMNNPEISVPGYKPSFIVYNSNFVASSLFNRGTNKCWHKPGPLWDQGYAVLYPFGKKTVDFMHKGTVSAWWFPNFSLQGGVMFNFHITDILYLNFQSGLGYTQGITLVDNGAEIETVYNIISQTWHHLYIIWDDSGGLSGGKTIKVYVDGILKYETDHPFLTTAQWEMSFNQFATVNIGGAEGYVDNIKIWNHVVSDGANAADWIKSAANPTDESGLHAIYGPGTYYQPVLKSPGGVGFYCIPSR